MPFTDSSARELVAVSGLDRFNKLVDITESAARNLLEVSAVHFDDANARSTGVIFVGWNKWQWTKLPDAAAPLVGAARSALNDLADFSDRAARLAPDRLKELKQLEKSFKRLVEQPNGSYPAGAPKQTIEQVSEFACELAANYRTAIAKLPNAFGDGERLLVVDTSAALDRPDLSEWRIDGQDWTVVLMPRLHSELDDRKRDQRTRDAARKVINQIEEFDRRGDTFQGVPLTGRLSLREVPVSPDMEQTLPWLRSNTPDDAFIAGALELMWADLTSRIAITASDRNLRNKARLAGLGVVHPRQL